MQGLLIKAQRLIQHGLADKIDILCANNLKVINSICVAPMGHDDIDE